MSAQVSAVFLIGTNKTLKRRELLLYQLFRATILSWSLIMQDKCTTSTVTLNMHYKKLDTSPGNSFFLL